eukprot:921503_1
MTTDSIFSLSAFLNSGYDQSTTGDGLSSSQSLSNHRLIYNYFSGAVTCVSPMQNTFYMCVLGTSTGYGEHALMRRYIARNCNCVDYDPWESIGEYINIDSNIDGHPLCLHIVDASDR